MSGKARQGRAAVVQYLVSAHQHPKLRSVRTEVSRAPGWLTWGGWCDGSDVRLRCYKTILLPLLSLSLVSCCCTTTWCTVSTQCGQFKTKQDQAGSITLTSQVIITNTTQHQPGPVTNLHLLPHLDFVAKSCINSHSSQILAGQASWRWEL